jgi:hypothetical protein
MYRAGTIQGDTVEALRLAVQQEFDKLAAAMAQPEDYSALKTLYAEPKRVFEGMVVKADGTTWNPGDGAGVYAYIGGAWVSLSAGGGGSFGLNVTSQTAPSLSVSATSGIAVVLCDCSSNAITINLPAASGNTATVIVKKTDSGSNTVTVDGSGAETIDGGATAVISRQYESISLVSSGSTWSIV